MTALSVPAPSTERSSPEAMPCSYHPHAGALHGEKVRGADGAEASGGLAAAAGAGELLLNEARIVGVTDEIFKVRAGKAEQLFAGRQGALQHGHELLDEAAEDGLQRGGVQAFLVLVVVVEQRLVDPGGLGDGRGAGPGHALGGELGDGLLQNGGAAGRRVARAGSVPVWKWRLP